MSVHDTTSNIREQLRTMLLRLNTGYDTETCVDSDLNSAMPGHLAPFKGLVPFYRSECSFFWNFLRNFIRAERAYRRAISNQMRSSAIVVHSFPLASLRRMVAPGNHWRSYSWITSNRCAFVSLDGILKPERIRLDRCIEVYGVLRRESRLEAKPRWSTKRRRRRTLTVFVRYWYTARETRMINGR